MTELVRADALYRQLANALRAAILGGEFAPGTPLPSEAALSERYKVSRPTVRQALAALRAEGLVTVVMGKGSFVRQTVGNPATLDRRVTAAGNGGYAQPDDDTATVEEPTTYRTNTDAVTGPLLGMGENEPVFATDRLTEHTDPATGATVRALRRVFVPFAVAEATPLEDDPWRTPSALYAVLAGQGHHLSWREYVSARMPLPDEASTLGIGDGTPLLHLHRVTLTDGTPLALEEIRTTAEGQRLAYDIPATTEGGTGNAQDSEEGSATTAKRPARRARKRTD
jgi:GntR family transcriptional regulator